MRAVSQSEVAGATEIDGTFVHPAARSCSFGRACKAIWPRKTAEQLATRAGCAIRTAAYELSGEREPSARSIAAIINEITKRN